ncbi:MAG: hypothetical protein AAFX76_08150, partial [Planctomycetota bacterium]
WLTTLSRAEPVGWTRAPREAQAPLAVIELALTGGRAERVRLYADRDGREDVLLAVRENEPVAALVPTGALAALLDPVVTLRSRALPAVDGLTELRLTRDDGHVFRFFRESVGVDGWQREGEAEGDGPGGVDFADLWRWVQRPRVREWTAMPELPRGPVARLSLGPDRPAYLVNVDTGLGQRTDLTGVFRLPAGVTALFAGEYRPVGLVSVAPDRVVSVRIENGSASGEVRRNADGAYVDADGQRLGSQADAASLFNTLSGLRARRLVDAPPPAAGDPATRVIQLTPTDGPRLELVRGGDGRWSMGDRRFELDAEVDADLMRLIELFGAETGE